MKKTKKAAKRRQGGGSGSGSGKAQLGGSTSGTLFISVESSGFVDMPEENEIPSLEGKFSCAALIYLTVSHVDKKEFYDQARELSWFRTLRSHSSHRFVKHQRS